MCWELDGFEARQAEYPLRVSRAAARKFQLYSRYRQPRPAAPLVSHKMSLEQGPEGYRWFQEKLDDCVRVVFTPRG